MEEKTNKPKSKRKGSKKKGDGEVVTKLLPNKDNYYAFVPLSKVPPEVVDTGVIESFQSEGDELVELTHGWLGMCLIFLQLYHYNKEDKFLKCLFDNKISSKQFEVSSKCINYIQGNNIVQSTPIGNTEFWFYSDLKGEHILEPLKKIAMDLDIDPKLIKCNIKPYTCGEPEDELLNGEVSSKNVKIALSNTPNIDINNNNIAALYLFDTRIRCKTYGEVLINFLSWTYEMYPDNWISRVEKYNRQDTLRVSRDVDTAQIAENKIKSIVGTEYYLCHIINANGIAMYLRELCKEFSIPDASIALEFSLLEFKETGNRTSR